MVDPVAATTIGMLLLGETLRGGTTGVLIVVVCVAGLTVAVRQLSVAQQLVQGAADRTDKTPSPGRR
ncbi:hypothetical protein ACQP1S_20645 [Micromonospora matsumotoense]|uniref:hypothetical protein n=1 Tax=Micromonospora matsumotoense TaxID=121616 RepID=UPI003D9016B3